MTLRAMLGLLPFAALLPAAAGLEHAPQWKRGIENQRQADLVSGHHNVAGKFLSLRPGLYAAGSGTVRFLDYRYRALP